MEPTVIRNVFSITFTFIMIDVVYGQETATPCSSGASTGNIPTIFLSVFEATQQDLQSKPDEYLIDLQINGNLTSVDSNNIYDVQMQILPPTEPQSISIDPSEVFRLESRTLKQPESGYSTRTFLRLIQPIDRDGPTALTTDDLNVIEFRIICQVAVSQVSTTYVIRVNIKDVNDNTPLFLNSSYSISVSEVMPVGTTILTISATDRDTGSNGAISYALTDSLSVNERRKFSIPSPSIGHVVLSHVLDFEQMEKRSSYIFGVIAVDGGNVSTTSSTTLLINILDADDQGPAFIYQGCYLVDGECLNPSYTTELSLNMVNAPERLHLRPAHDQRFTTDLIARDKDSLNARVSLEIVETIPLGYQNHFFLETMDSPIGSRAFMMQVLPIDRTKLQRLTIVIKATEMTDNKHYNRAVIDAIFRNSSCANIANEPCPSITPIVGGVLGALLILVVLILIVVLVLLWKQRRADGANISESTKPQLYLKKI